MSGPALVWPFDRSSVFDVPAAYARLRSDSPIHRVELPDGREALLLTRYADVRAVMNSATLSANVHLDGFPSVSAAALASKRLQRSFVRMDPPSHGRQRALVSPEFMAARVRAYHIPIEAHSAELIHGIMSKGSTCDLVSSFARPLPARVVCDMLSVHVDEVAFVSQQVVQWSTSERTSEVAAAGEQILRFLGKLLDMRNTAARDDLVERIRVQAASRDEAVQLLFLLVVSGFHTTANMISLAVVVAIRYRLFDLINSRPDLLPAIVEEVLRFVSVAQHTALRLAVEDTSLPSGMVMAGDAIIAPIPAANHDPAVFRQPRTFRVDRATSRHLAFGAGIHNCLGQRLARAELGIALKTLAQRVPSLALAVPPNTLAYTSGATFGLRALPVRW